MTATRRNPGLWPVPFLAAVLLPLCPAWSQRPLERSDARPDRDEELVKRGEIEATEPGGFFASDDTVLVEKLKAILLLSKDGSGSEQPREPGSVEDHGVDAPDEVLQTLERYLGHSVSLDILNEMARTVVLAYRKSDRPVVDVYFPEQEITGGVVRLHVVEGVLGEVRVEGAKHSDPDYLIQNIRVEPGEVLRSSSLSRDLDWLNRNPLRGVCLLYERGEEEGTSDVLLSVMDAKPFYIFSTVGNTGLDATGEYEWSAGFLWGHFVDTEAFLSYNATTDLDFENLLSHSVYGKAPLPWRHEIEAFGSYVRTDSEFVLSGVNIATGGSTKQAGLGYVIPLKPVSPGALHEITLGVDYKRSNSDLEFGGTSVFAETAVVFQIRSEYGITVPDKLGQTTFEIAAIYSPGDVLNHNDRASFAALNPGADPHYWYGRANVDRLVDLPFNLQFNLRARGQWTENRLLPSEQHLMGGYDSVRGYDEFLLRGDRGLIVNAELETAPYDLPAIADLPLSGTVVPYVFYDLGLAETVEPFPGESVEELQSFGVGAHIKLGKQTRIEGAYGWGFNLSDDFEEPDAGKLHFAIRSRF